MTLYLGIDSTVNEEGRARLAPASIAAFLMDGLREAVEQGSERDACKRCG